MSALMQQSFIYETGAKQAQVSLKVTSTRLFYPHTRKTGETYDATDKRYRTGSSHIGHKHFDLRGTVDRPAAEHSDKFGAAFVDARRHYF